MAFTPRKGMTEERRHRANKALALRRDGHVLREIAEINGVSISTTAEDIKLALQEITRENAEELLTLELDRLDDDQKRLTEALDAAQDALEEETLDMAVWLPNVARLISQRLAVGERRARLLGLDVVKHDVSAELLQALATGFEVLDDTPLEELDPDGEF